MRLIDCGPCAIVEKHITTSDSDGDFIPFSAVADVTEYSSESHGGQALYGIRATLKAHAIHSRWRRHKVLARGVPSRMEARRLVRHIRNSIRRFGGQPQH